MYGMWVPRYRYGTEAAHHENICKQQKPQKDYISDGNHLKAIAFSALCCLRYHTYYIPVLSFINK
jgi:hypothetical protein